MATVILPDIDVDELLDERLEAELLALLTLELFDDLLDEVDDTDDVDEVDDLLLDETLLELTLDDEADIDDLLLDDELLVLITLLVLDIEDADETLVALLALDSEEEKTLVALLDDRLEACDEATDVLLTLPLPEVLDELLPTVPPEHAVVSNAMTAIDTNPEFLIIFLLPYTGVTQSKQ